MSANETGTPRTDAEIMFPGGGICMVRPEFARQLERELAALREENKKLRELDAMRLYIEHGWLCARNETGQLYWSTKLTDIGDADVMPDITAALSRAGKGE